MIEQAQEVVLLCGLGSSEQQRSTAQLGALGRRYRCPPIRGWGKAPQSDEAAFAS